MQQKPSSISAVTELKNLYELDPGFRRDDDNKKRHFFLVIPAKAGIQFMNTGVAGSFLTFLVGFLHNRGYSDEEK